MELRDTDGVSRFAGDHVIAAAIPSETPEYASPISVPNRPALTKIRGKQEDVIVALCGEHGRFALPSLGLGGGR